MNDETGNDVTSPLEPRTGVSGVSAILALDPQIALLRQAKFELEEGNRLAREDNLTEARQQWLAAAESFRAAQDSLGLAEAYQQLANSHLFRSWRWTSLEDMARDVLGEDFSPKKGEEPPLEAMSALMGHVNLAAMMDPKIMKQILNYFLQSGDAAAQIYESLIRQDLPFDPKTLNAADELFRQGRTAYEEENWPQAIDLLNRSSALFDSIDFGSGVARCLTLEARCHFESGNAMKAMSSAMEALRVVSSLPLGNRRQEDFLTATGHLERGHYVQAETALRESLKTYDAAKDTEGAAGVSLNLGITLARLGRLGEARVQLLETISRLQGVSDSSEHKISNRAATHHNLANLASEAGFPKESLSHFCLALEDWGQTVKPENELASLVGIGSALREVGQLQESSTILWKAQELLEQVSPQPETQSDILNNLGLIHYQRAEYESAQSFLEQALTLRQGLPDRSKVAESRLNLSNLLFAQGKLDAAQSILEEALSEARKAGWTGHETKILSNRATIQERRGNFQAALRDLRQALTQLKAAGNRSAQGVLHVAIGTAYFDLGQGQVAREHTQAALQIFEEIGDPVKQAQILTNLGSIELRQQNPPSARRHFEAARKIWQAQGDLIQAHKVTNDLALLALQSEDFEAAKELLQPENDKRLNPFDRIQAFFIRALLQLRLENPSQALKESRKALELAKKLGLPSRELGPRILMAFSHALLGEHRKARSQLDATSEVLESLHEGLTVPELKGSFQDQFTLFYELGVLYNLDRKDDEGAFLLAEKSRVRAFLNQLGNRRIELRQGARQALIDKELELQRALLAVDADLDEEWRKSSNQRTPGRLPHLSARRQTLRQEYTRLLTELKIENPAYAELLGVGAKGLNEFRSKLAGKNTTIVSFYVPQETFDLVGVGDVMAWVVTAQKAQGLRLPIDAQELARLTRSFRRDLTNGHFPQDSASLLYERLIAPLRPLLKTSQLVIVPHGVLHSLPFAALWDPSKERFLAQDFAMSLLPSISSMSFLEERLEPTGGDVLVFGNPDGSLPHAGAEARAVAARYQQPPWLGDRAKEAVLHQKAPGARILHIAAHSRYDSSSPQFSHIQLNPGGGHDGSLEVREVLELPLHTTELVVLSACETGLAYRSSGDDPIGLPHAFLYAGARSVLATHWPVNDEASAKFMEFFYRAYEKGFPAAKALSRAQRAMRKQEEWQSPFYWAGFQVHGSLPKAAVEAAAP